MRWITGSLIFFSVPFFIASPVMAQEAKDSAGKGTQGEKPKPPEKGSGVAESPSRPTPKFKSPETAGKFQEALENMEFEDYTKARSLFRACLGDTTTAEDKKILLGLIDDTKLGTELVAAKKYAQSKNERKAIAKVQKALNRYPDSALVPLAEKFIQECEELIYLVLDDFEPGGSLDQFTKKRKEDPEAEEETRSTSSSTISSSRWNSYHTFNADPRFVRHGKGSLQWRLGGDYGYTGYTYYYGRGYRSAKLSNPITKWRYLVFSVFLPEADEGNLRVMLTPEIDTGVLRSLYTLKFIELRGKRGWLDIRLDLHRDFGGTRFLKLEDIRYIRIDNMHVKYRTIYLDYVHLE